MHVYVGRPVPLLLRVPGCCGGASAMHVCIVLRHLDPLVDGHRQRAVETSSPTQAPWCQCYVNGGMTRALGPCLHCLLVSMYQGTGRAKQC